MTSWISLQFIFVSGSAEFITFRRLVFDLSKAEGVAVYVLGKSRVEALKA